MNVVTDRKFFLCSCRPTQKTLFEVVGVEEQVKVRVDLWLSGWAAADSTDNLWCSCLHLSLLHILTDPANSDASSNKGFRNPNRSCKLKQWVHGEFMEVQKWLVCAKWHHRSRGWVWNLANNRTNREILPDLLILIVSSLERVVSGGKEALEFGVGCGL